MEKLYQYLPEELVTFILVTVFSLLIAISSIFLTRRTIACLWVAGLSWGCCLP